MVNQTDKPIMVSECERKHRGTTIILGLLVAIMTFGAGGIGWAVNAGYQSSRDSLLVAYQLEVVKMRQEEQYQALSAVIERMSREVEKQRSMIEDLWRQNKGGNP